MRKRILVMFAALSAAFALAGASAASAAPSGPDFTEEAIDLGLTRTQAADLQDRVDDVLANVPGGTQISATEIQFDGATATVDPYYSESDFSTNAISCSSGSFCINVRGTEFVFVACQRWTLTDWWGSSPWNNNQTGSVLARAYASNGSTVVWSDRANSGADSGYVDVTPWYYFRPC